MFLTQPIVECKAQSNSAYQSLHKKIVKKSYFYLVILVKYNPHMMENILSVPSAACVKFQGLDKFIALNIRCFVKHALFVFFCVVCCLILWVM